MFEGGGSVVVDSLFIVAPLWGFCVCPMFCCRSSDGKRELVALLCLPGVL